MEVKPRSVEGPLSAGQRGHMAAQKSSVRQCLTGARLAPCNDDTLSSLQRKRQEEVVRELPEHVRAFVPETPLVVDKEIFEESQVITTRFISPGPDESTYEHLKVLMDDVDAFELLYEAVNG